MTRSIFGVLASGAWLLSARAALAQEPALAYQVPAGCPAQAEFVAAVEARGAHFQGAEAVARARALNVRIEPTATGFVGSLEVTRPDGTASSREIHDPTCGDVVTGLAVIAAIALGGRAEAGPSEAADEAPTTAAAEHQSGASSSAVTTPEEDPAAAPVSRPRLRGTNLRLPGEIPVEAGTLRIEQDNRYTLGAGIDYGLLRGFALPRAEFTISTANFILPPSASSYLIGHVLQVQWSFLGPGTHRSGDYSTRVLGFGASLNSCSGLTYDDQGLSLLVCGEFGASFVSLETESADGAFSRRRETGFGHAALGVDAQYSLGDTFHVAMRLGGRAQLGDISAERPDGSELFDMPLFGAYGTLGVGLHF
jgi:hypothetical protein